MRSALFIGATAILALACNGVNDQGNPAANIVYDNDRYPGNDNEPLGQHLDSLQEVGSIQSYNRLPEDGENDAYDNIFRRDVEDADFSTYTTEDDLDMPHKVPQGSPADLDPDYVDNTETGRPSASTIERYDPQRTVEQYDGVIDVKEDRPLGTTRASMPDGAKDDEEDVRGGQQTAIGATGTDNYRLEEYYDTDEENYGYNDDSDGGEWGSWYRPLSDNEKAYNEDVIRLGDGDRSPDYTQRYNQLKEKMYSIPENQQSVLYAPANYTYSFLTDWNGLAMSTKVQRGSEYGNETAFDRPPLMGTGCEQADDPVTCSTTNLDKELKQFLNDPRIVRDMMRLGVKGINFDVDQKGRIRPNTIEVVKADGVVCEDNDCTMFNTAIRQVFRELEWTPGQRLGVPTVSRLELPLVYEQAEEIQDL